MHIFTLACCIICLQQRYVPMMVWALICLLCLRVPFIHDHYWTSIPEGKQTNHICYNGQLWWVHGYNPVPPKNVWSAPSPAALSPMQPQTYCSHFALCLSHTTVSSRGRSNALTLKHRRLWVIGSTKYANWGFTSQLALCVRNTFFPQCAD